MAFITVDILTDFANKLAIKVTDIFVKKIDIPIDAKYTDTTYNPMVGATASTKGESGLVPEPPKGDANRYLCSDGTFKEIAEATSVDIDQIINESFGIMEDQR